MSAGPAVVLILAVLLVSHGYATDPVHAAESGNPPNPPITAPAAPDDSAEHRPPTVFELRIDRPRGCDAPVTVRYLCDEQSVELVFDPPTPNAPFATAGSPIDPRYELAEVWEHIRPAIGLPELARAD